jgi:uncharacterized protein YndB with AHSA1/START domain
MPEAAEQNYGEGKVAITRVFDAPRALVWQAWTDPKMMAQWFGPRGFTSSVPELDLRVRGALRIVMHGPDGNDYPMKGVFTEVKAPERLVFSNIALNNDGNHLLEGETTVTFSERSGKTTLHVVSHMVGRVPIAPHRQTGRAGGLRRSIKSATRSSRASARSSTIRRWPSDCGGPRRGRWPRPFPAPAPGRCG